MGVEPRLGSDTLLLRPRQAAADLGISERKLWELTNCGEIPCVRIGRSVRYSRQTLVGWIDDREASER